MRLTRIDVTHRHYAEPGIQWLINNDYRYRLIGNRVYLERSVSWFVCYVPRWLRNLISRVLRTADAGQEK